MEKVTLTACAFYWECPKGHSNETHENDYEPYGGDGFNIVKCEDCGEDFSCEYAD